MHMTKIQPSAVRKSCTGTADGCELRGSRSVSWPSFRYQLPGYVSWCSATSNSDTSMSPPRPDFITPIREESTATAVVMPVM